MSNEQMSSEERAAVKVALGELALRGPALLGTKHVEVLAAVAERVLALKRASDQQVDAALAKVGGKSAAYRCGEDDILAQLGALAPGEE